MEIKDMNYEQITARIAELNAIKIEEKSAEEIKVLNEEFEQLNERKKEFDAQIEKRKSLVQSIVDGSAATVVKTFEGDKTMQEERLFTIDSKEYRDAWLKNLLNRDLSDLEKRSVAATNVAGAIPTMTYDTIFDKIVQTAPLLNEVTLLRVAGNVNFAVEGTNNAAAIHTENGEVTPAADTLVTVSLAGYEIVKIVRISATVQTMSINAFETWLTDMLAEAVARVIENYIINGSGSSEPKGVAQAQTWSDGTNGVDWASTKPTYAELVELVSYLPGGFARGAKFLMNHKTFWGDVQAIRDDGKAPIVKEDAGGYRIMGFPVIFSDYVADGDIYLGNFKKIVANLSQDIKVDSSAASGFVYNAIDYRGAAIFDCDVAIGTAFVKGEATLSNS